MLSFQREVSSPPKGSRRVKRVLFCASVDVAGNKSDFDVSVLRVILVAEHPSAAHCLGVLELTDIALAGYLPYPAVEVVEFLDDMVPQSNQEATFRWCTHHGRHL